MTFKKGSFEYSTIYVVPAGLTDSSAEGDVAGTMVLNAGTEISFSLYKYSWITQVIQFMEFLSSSDDVNRVDPTLMMEHLRK